LFDGFSLSTTADLLSIIGFTVTVWVAIDLTLLKRRYLFRARIPELRDRLGDYASRVSSLMGSYPLSAAEVKIQLAEAEVFVRSLRKKTSGPPRRAASELLRLMRDRRAVRERDDVERIWTAMKILQLEIEDRLSDLEWSR
jgi:hypothetical protein